MNLQYINKKLSEAEIILTTLQFVQISPSSFEKWTLLDTINHVNAWKRIALEKVQLKIDGKEATYHSSRSIEVVNREIYNQNSSNDAVMTKAFIEQNQKVAEQLFHQILGKETSMELCPTGFKGNVSAYLLYDLILHPAKHYLSFFMKTNDDKMFDWFEIQLLDPAPIGKGTNDLKNRTEAIVAKLSSIIY